MTAALAAPLAADHPAPDHPAVATRDIGGIAVAALARDAALGVLAEAFSTGRHLKLAFCNAHLVNIAAHDRSLRQQLAGFLVLADGIGVELGSRLLHGASFPANLNGTDFTPALLSSAPQALRVGLIGGRPGVAERAAAHLAQAHARHRFTVLGHGFFALGEEAALLARLQANPPDLLLVAFGNPLQEHWIATRLGSQHCTVAAGVGALFDFLAGEVPRAPSTMRRLRLEWLYRLWREPARLWRRYVLGNPAFLLRMLRLRILTRRSA